jgi:YHS domain-containing protein
MKNVVLSLFVALTNLITSAQKSEVFTKSGTAINGYDPVAYFKEGQAAKGTDQFVYNWNGADWRFSNQQNLDSFKTSPQKFAPQYGGYCAYGMYEGHKAPTEPDAWTIVNGKLYFNYNLKVRELWRDKKEEKIETADKNWPGIKDKE